MQNEFITEILEIINSNLSDQQLVERLDDYHVSDIADALETLSTEERLRIYKILGLEMTSEIFSHYDDVIEYVEEIKPEFAADIVEQMDSNDAVDILNELEAEDKEEILSLMEDEAQEKVKQIDAYDENLIGSYMSDNYIYLKKDLSIKQAMNKLVKYAGEYDNISTLYLVDENKRFFGAITLRDLIIARKEDSLIDLCMTSYPYFYDDEEMSDCINRLKDYAEDSIPVINHNDELLGVITQDLVTLALDEEMSEDYAKLGGLSESEELSESVFTSIKKRIPWLVILLFLGFIVSSVIGAFEAVITALPALVFFQSMISAMAGNVGTQSLAVTLRNITDEEIKGREIRRNVSKEIRVGFFNGLLVGIIAFVFVMVYLVIRKQEIIIGEGYSFPNILIVSMVISISLLLGMTISSFIGTIFPIILDKMHIDPAVASGPFITTLNDVIAIVVYYGLTSLLFFVFL